MDLALNLLKTEHVGVRRFRNHLFELLKEDSPLVITERGHPAKVILGYEEVLELLDILDELSDPEAITAVVEGRKAIAAGTRGVSATDIIKKYKIKK